MKENLKSVIYSYESGDKSLPKLIDLVSETSDPYKKIILNYLETNCILASPGIITDEITPNETIGCGNIYSDSFYMWDDALIGYVRKYNITLPKEFREHILKNHSNRAKRHLLLSIVDKLIIEISNCNGDSFYLSVHKDGIIQHKSHQSSLTEFHISADKAKYIIAPVMTQLFCYGGDNSGNMSENSYHWKLTFYKKDRIIDTVDGCQGEDKWRYDELKRCIKFIQKYIPVRLDF